MGGDSYYYRRQGDFMNRVRWAILGLLIFGAGVRPASADATLFIGANTTPANRGVKGFAAGGGLLVVAFEFEYANTSADEPAGTAPSVKTGMGNVLLQTPSPSTGSSRTSPLEPGYTGNASGLSKKRDLPQTLAAA